MRYIPRPATFTLKYPNRYEDNWDEASESFANESDAHIRMASLFEEGFKKVVLEKSTVYEVEK